MCRRSDAPSDESCPSAPPPPPPPPPSLPPPRIPGAGQLACREVLHPGRAVAIEKDAVGTDELERIPLDRVVARGEHDAPGGTVVQSGELCRGSGGEPEIDHIAADGHEPRDRGVREHRAGNTGVTSQHDGRVFPFPFSLAPVPRHRPHPERRRIARDGFRSEVLADDAANAGYADHERVGHGGNVETVGGRVNPTRSGASHSAGTRGPKHLPLGGGDRQAADFRERVLERLHSAGIELPPLAHVQLFQRSLD